MKKTLNIDSITNELREHSPFFRRQPAPPPSETPIQQPAVQEPQHTRLEAIQPELDDQPRTPRSVSTSRTPRTGYLPSKRHMKRHAFEIYLDQYDSLVRLAAQDRLRGGVGSMSQMVREAIDRLIAERSGKKAT